MGTASAKTNLEVLAGVGSSLFDDSSVFSVALLQQELPLTISAPASYYVAALKDYIGELFRGFSDLKDMMSDWRQHFSTYPGVKKFNSRLMKLVKTLDDFKKDEMELTRYGGNLEQLLEDAGMHELKAGVQLLTHYVIHDLKKAFSSHSVYAQILNETLVERLEDLRQMVLNHGFEIIVRPEILKCELPKKIMAKALTPKDAARIEGIKSAVYHCYREAQYLHNAVNNSGIMEKVDICQVFSEAFSYVFHAKHTDLKKDMVVRTFPQGSTEVVTNPGALYRAIYNHLNNIAEEIQKQCTNPFGNGIKIVIDPTLYEIGLNIYPLRGYVVIDIRDRCGGFSESILRNGNGYKSSKGNGRGFGRQLAKYAITRVGGKVTEKNHAGPVSLEDLQGDLTMFLDKQMLYKHKDKFTVGAAYLIRIPRV
ncbi:hypothetical protein HYU06_01640 [Candidatus Woesearchaeota archaeon]|nr:hypothetical protein [Candidatus Woesearchaeota archaeon]